MTTVDYFLLSENAIADKTDKVSLINIYDIINTPVLPVAHPKFSFSFRVQPDKKQITKEPFEFKLIVITPSGKQAVEVRGTAQYDKKIVTDTPQVASTIDLSGLPLPEEGKYRAELYLADQLIATRPFSIVLQKGLQQ